MSNTEVLSPREVTAGTTVYFVESLPQGDWAVKKGKVSYVHDDWVDKQRNISVAVLDDVYDPASTTHMRTKSPAELFTRQQVKKIIKESDLELDNTPLDDIVDDPITNRGLTVALGGVTLQRMSEDLLSNI